MLKQLLFFFIWTIFDFSAGKLFHNGISTSGIHRMYAKLVAVKLLAKRDVCQSWQYSFQGICCDLCKPGFFAKPPGCTKDNHTTNCIRCREGKEYMDKHNFNTACLRCNRCDEEHGLENEYNCTIYQNVICRCKPDYFCSSPKPCRHCDPCIKCENGITAEKCTQTQNTKCGSKDRFHRPWIILAAFIIPVIMTIRLCLWNNSSLPKRPKTTRHPDPVYSNHEFIELKKCKYPDVDLSPFIAEIAHMMDLKDIKKVVRNLGVHSAQIDDIKNEHLNESYEQKIKLLEGWYQKNGKKGAYKTLMTSLRKLGFRMTADHIEQRIERQQNGSD